MSVHIYKKKFIGVFLLVVVCFVEGLNVFFLIQYINYLFCLPIFVIFFCNFVIETSLFTLKMDNTSSCSILDKSKFYVSKTIKSYNNTTFFFSFKFISSKQTI